MFRQMCSMDQFLIVEIQLSDDRHRLQLVMCILAILWASVAYH